MTSLPGFPPDLPGDRLHYSGLWTACVAAPKEKGPQALMIRVAVLADIHGNLPAQFQADEVVVAGDLINWGPYSERVLEFVAERGWAAIRGNHELYLAAVMNYRREINKIGVRKR